jgi:amidase
MGARLTATAALLVALALTGAQAQRGGFQIEEATIAETHRAIQSGETTCVGVVEAYLERARAYNGTCTALVTQDGEPIAPARGTIRAGAPLAFPTNTVPVADVLPDLDQYRGLPLELGRMEPTISDASVMQQFGMRVGISNARQVNALETLNIRGERSVTCKGEFDRHPKDGPLPKDAPAACEEFRKQPDALERAAELDAKYGRNPDLEALPMYCVAFAWKNWYDATDMRATGGNDVNFAMDAPKHDHPDIAQLRAKGAISYAVAGARSTSGPSADGPEKPKTYMPDGNYRYGLWGGQPCNPYDTERETRGTSSGSGVAIAANLAACSICEQTVASCMGPASRNGIVNLLTTKGVLMDGGAGYSEIGDRAGIHCRTVEDAVAVLDAVRGYESRDPFTAIAPALIPKEPYASFLVKDVGGKPLAGMRIAIVREFMVKHGKNDEAISDGLDAEIKAVLRDQLGAELVESVEPLYADDPTVPNMKYTFQRAFAELLPPLVPELFWQKARGELEFAVPGWDVTSLDYAVALVLGEAPLSPKLNLRRITGSLGTINSSFYMDKYLRERGDVRIKDWASWVANAKWGDDASRTGYANAVAANVQDLRADPDQVNYLAMHTAFRLIVQRVMNENGIDAFVNPEQTTPPYRIGRAQEPSVNGRSATSCCTRLTALMGGPEIEVPAGFATVEYAPRYVLTADKTEYMSAAGAVQTKLPHPMPISLMFWAAPGADSTVVKVASAYEAATHHRKPPPAFGAVEKGAAATSGR